MSDRFRVRNPEAANTSDRPSVVVYNVPVSRSSAERLRRSSQENGREAPSRSTASAMAACRRTWDAPASGVDSPSATSRPQWVPRAITSTHQPASGPGSLTGSATVPTRPTAPAQLDDRVAQSSSRVDGCSSPTA
jgi:hypothetical protein